MTTVQLGSIAGDAHRLQIPEILTAASGNGDPVVDLPSAPSPKSPVVRERELDSTAGATAVSVVEDLLEPRIGVRRHKRAPEVKSGNLVPSLQSPTDFSPRSMRSFTASLRVHPS